MESWDMRAAEKRGILASQGYFDDVPILFELSEIKTILAGEYLEAVEAGIAAGTLEEKKALQKVPFDVFEKTHVGGYNAAIVNAEKQSKSWLKK